MEKKSSPELGKGNREKSESNAIESQKDSMKNSVEMGENDNELEYKLCNLEVHSVSDLKICKEKSGHTSKDSLDYFNQDSDYSEEDSTCEAVTCTDCGEKLVDDSSLEDLYIEYGVNKMLQENKKDVDSSEMFTCLDCLESKTPSNTSLAILNLSQELSEYSVDSSNVFTCSSCNLHQSGISSKEFKYLEGDEIINLQKPSEKSVSSELIDDITENKDEKDKEDKQIKEDKEDTISNASEDSRKDFDTSKAVTFAEDMEIYDLTSKSHIPITVSLDTPVHLIDHALVDLPATQVNVLPALINKDPETTDLSDKVTPTNLGEDCSEADRKFISEHVDERPIPAVRPSILPLSTSSVDKSHEQLKQKCMESASEIAEKANNFIEEPTSNGHKSFVVVSVDEAELQRGEAQDKKPLLEVTPSQIESSGLVSNSIKSQSSDSFIHDTIGPLDNPAFLKSLQYASSQRFEDDHFGLHSNLDLCSITTLPVSTDLDRGWAWVVLCAAFFAQVILGGSVYSTGVLLSAIVEEMDTDLSAASWIGSVHVCVSSFTGPIAGVVVNRLGSRVTVCVAGVVSTIGFLSASFCSTVGQLILTHGVIAGIGAGFTINSVFVCVGQYFCRYRAVACGLLAAGAGTGMFSGGALMSFLLSKYGLSGAYMLWSSIVFHFTAIGLLLRPSPAEKLEKEVNSTKASVNQLGRPERISIMSGMNSLFGSVNQSMLSGMDKISRRSVNSRLSTANKPSHADADQTLLKAVLNKEMSRSNSVCTTRSSILRPSSPLAASRHHLSVGDTHRQHSISPKTPTSPAFPVTTNPVNSTNPLTASVKDLNSSNLLNISNVSASSKPSSVSSSFFNINNVSNEDVNINHSHASSDMNSNPSHFNSVVNNNSMDNVNSNWNQGPNSHLQSASQFVSSSTLNASSRHPLSSPTSGTIRPHNRPLSTGSQYASTSHISARLSFLNNFGDNESVSSALVSQLRPRDAIAPRHPLGSLSFSMMGSVASFPTSLALLKDDLARHENYSTFNQKKTFTDHVISFLDSLRILRKSPFMILLLSNFLWAFGESPVMIYLATYAMSRGTNEMQASFLYTTMGIGSVCGRFLSGLASGNEEIGPVIIFMGCLGLSGLMVMLMPWLTSTVTQQMVYSCLLGVYTGALVPLNSLIFIDLLGVGELGLGFGFLSMSRGTGYLIGPPLSGFLVSKFGFMPSFICAGMTLVLASLSSFFLVAFLTKSDDEDDEEDRAMDELEQALRRISDSGSYEVNEEDLIPSGVADASVSLDDVFKGEKSAETNAKEEKDLDTILE